VQFCTGKAVWIILLEKIPPLRQFGPGDRIYVQAQQVWLILVAIVMLSERNPKRPTTISYGELAQKMGFKDKRAGHMLGRQLGIVGQYCKIHDLPTLNAIVVHESDGKPGKGVITRSGKHPTDEQSATMRVDWFRIRVPTTGTFRSVWSAGFED
jgi:hypothetical protein